MLKKVITAKLDRGNLIKDEEVVDALKQAQLLEKFSESSESPEDDKLEENSDDSEDRSSPAD